MSFRWCLAKANIELGANFGSVMKSQNLPFSFKKAKMIGILKPGEDGDKSEHFRPISLLSVVHKWFGKQRYKRMALIIDIHTPHEQAGLKEGRDCCDQVLVLTSLIEAGCQHRQRTGVWIYGLLFKLMKIIPCKKLYRMVAAMLGGRKSKTFISSIGSADGAQWTTVSPKVPYTLRSCSTCTLWTAQNRSVKISLSLMIRR